MANPVVCMLLRPFMRKKNAQKLASGNSEINESRYVSINGVDQWITVRGQKKSNPVMLIVHGGPGSTYTPFNVLLLDWEKHFTIVQWDQIGSGKTYKKNGATANLGFERLADDGIELARYLREYLHCIKIILLGSSAGSLIGVKMIQKAPDYFCAYVGAEQNSPDSGLFYQTLKEYARKNDKKALQFLEKTGGDKSRWTKDDVDRINRIAIRVDKNAPNMIYDLMLPAIMYDSEYSMKDIQIMSKGMEYALKNLYAEMVNFDFDGLGYQFKIPFFIFQGEYDILTPVADARRYFEKIEAPHKEFVLIQNAGHLAAFANPSRFLHELVSRVLPLCQ
jgi:pimeloyl-ACP methyl ester carboxylesterase